MNWTDKIILGTVQMGLAYGISNDAGQISMEESHAILKAAYINGIRVLDSAAVYGNAHEVIGRFHKDNPTMKFQVITKLPHIIKEDLESILSSYLDDLGVLQLEALLFHSFSTYQEYAGELENLKANNSAKSIGVSIYTNREFETVMNDPLVDIIQLPFNLLDNYSFRGHLLEKAKALGKIIHTRSAYLQGLFFQSVQSEKKIVQALKPEIIQINKIAEKHGLSIQELSLSYCLKQGLIDNVLIGVDSESQLLANLKVVDLELDNGILEEINYIQVEDINLLNPSLWSKL